jgi:hypothetical protein
MKARYRYNQKTRFRRNQIIGIHDNANTGSVNLATGCILFGTERPDLRRHKTELLIVSQLAVSIRDRHRRKKE